MDIGGCSLFGLTVMEDLLVDQMHSHTAGFCNSSNTVTEVNSFIHAKGVLRPNDSKLC